MDSVGEGEGGKIWENGIETCKISCMKRDASPGSMHDTGCLGLVHWDDPVHCVCVYNSEKAMAPHSSTLAWKIPWTEEPGRLQSMGSLRVDMTEQLHFHFSLACIGEGNGNPLQCSCLEDPRDGGAWWATVCGVAQSQTRLKRLSSSSSSRELRSQMPHGQKKPQNIKTTL